MLGQIVEPDLVLLAPPGPSDELARCGAQRLLGVEDVRGGTHLLADHCVGLWIVIVKLEKFRWDVAGRLEPARAEVVFNGDEGGASAREHHGKRDNDEQPHARSTAGWTWGLWPNNAASARSGQSGFCRPDGPPSRRSRRGLRFGRPPSGTPAASKAACWRAASAVSSKSSINS